MPTRLQLIRFMRSRESEIIAAALLTLAAMATVSAPAGADARGQSTILQAVVTIADGGLPDRGLPPSPGPNNPNGPAY
ncbi:MAG TPA: hypothetical protein VFZ16_11355 [Hyphomicrobiaceae bacterium]|nr:hypothetical protein [Hyphomicrobiaceae bacterium]